MARRFLCAALSVALVGCGTPFTVITEPPAADIYVDGSYVGSGAATCETNGVVFVHLHVREAPAAPPPPELDPEKIDRPVLEIASPAQGDSVPASITLKGRARHWSGVSLVRVELDGTLVKELRPKDAEVELRFEVPVAIEKTGRHVIRIVAKGSRGIEANEELRVARVLPGEAAPAAPLEIVPGLDETEKRPDARDKSFDEKK